MKAYYYDESAAGDQRAPHEGPAVELDVLARLGLISRPGLNEQQVDALAEERGYKCRDMITVSKEGLGDMYETKLKSFFDEHLHEDEEIRYIKEGSGFFDVRDKSDKNWIRVAMGPDDLLVLPAGIYHRFTLDEGDYVKAVRLFKEEPKWTPLSRKSGETDENFHRRQYLDSLDHHH